MLRLVSEEKTKKKKKKKPRSFNLKQRRATSQRKGVGEARGCGRRGV